MKKPIFITLTFLLFLGCPEYFSQSITTVSPNQGYQGQTLMVSITGQNTNFNQGTAVTNVWFRQGTSTLIYPISNFTTSLTNVIAQFFLDFIFPPGNYDVLAYNAIDGLITYSNAFNISPSATEVHDSKVSSALAPEIFPNPGSGIFFMNNSDAEKISSIRIFNIEGKELLALNCDPYSRGRIDLSSFSPGIYVIRLEGQENIFLQKVVIY